MNCKRWVFAGVLLLGLAGSARGQVQSEDLDVFPLFARSMTVCKETTRNPDFHATRWSFLAGLIEWERRADYLKFRVAPLLYQRRRNEHYIHPILFGGTDYSYDSRKGVRLDLLQLETDLLYTALVAWRGPSEDPHFSGGFAALIGELIWNYGFRSFEGNPYRAWVLTEGLVLVKDEKYGRRFFSLGGLVWSVGWDRPGESGTWHVGMAANSLCFGKNAGRPYGRFVWLPIGKAPALREQLPFLGPVHWLKRVLHLGKPSGDGKPAPEAPKNRVSV